MSFQDSVGQCRSIILCSMRQYLKLFLLSACFVGTLACYSTQRANVSGRSAALTNPTQEAKTILSTENSATKEQKKAHSSTISQSKGDVERKYDLAESHYRQGKYHQSEQLLKECLLLNPFLAKANLLLGKLFLLQSAGSKDRSLVESAKLMFEMALRNDPNLREAKILLGLFKRDIH